MDTFPTPSPFDDGTAELIVRNGRQQGTRRTLKSPVTIIGSTKGCDVRLNVDSIRPFHCVIALGPSGLHLRSWGTDDTFVNGDAVQSRLLSDGDILKLGPFEFEVRWIVPVAAPVENEECTIRPKVVIDSPANVENDEKCSQLRVLQRQLGEARADFRREKAIQAADVARQLRELANARQDLERPLAETTRERTRLESLRTRFIRRWKKHWSTQQRHIDRENERIAKEIETLDRRRADFEIENAQFQAFVEVEKRRIEYGWEQLRSTQCAEQTKQARSKAESELHRQLNTREQERLNAQKHALHDERMRLERESAQLRIEIDGLQSRAVNLRSVLLNLEAQRISFRGAGSIANDAIPFPVEKLTSPSNNVVVQSVDATDLHHRKLETLVDDLADQRLILNEQINRLASARESWREEEERVIAELSSLTEQLRQREDQVEENEKAIAFEKDQLERERTRMCEFRERLEGWQSRLEMTESRSKAESERIDLELQQRSKQLERRDRALTEICKRWSDRRRREVIQLRTEHRRCEQLRMTWSAERSTHEQLEKQLADLELQLAARSLILEHAQQELLKSVDDHLLAEKRLERLGRHVRSTLNKNEKKLERRWQASVAENHQLSDLYRQVSERIEQFIRMEREISNRLAELEHRELRITERELSLTETESVWKSQRMSYDRERNDLHNEIDRLAGIIIHSHEKDEQLTRAA